jgi:hypothetical protein
LLLTPLAGEGNGAKRKDVTVKWIEGTLLPRLLKYIQDIKKEEVDKYLKIAGVETESTTTEDSVELFWADKSIELSPDGDNKGYYKISKSNSSKILVDDLVKISGEVKKGSLVKLTDVIRGGQKVPEFEETSYETGSLSKIMVGGVEVETHTFTSEGNNEEELKRKLSTIKNDTNKMGTISKVVDAMDDPEN